MNTPKTGKNAFYWERACHFFRGSEFVASEGSYFFHNKNSKNVKIGVMCQISVSVEGESISYTRNGEQTTIPLLSDDFTYKRVEKLLQKDTPYFFIVSPDIDRQFVDKSLPRMFLVQPGIEFTFSPDQINGRISYAQDSDREQQGNEMLRASSEEPLSAQPDYSNHSIPFSQMAVDWIPAEGDESFSNRLDNAIALLQGYPDGKNGSHPLFRISIGCEAQSIQIVRAACSDKWRLCV